MADEFEWQTDVDSGWEPPLPESVRPGRPPSPRRGPIVAVIVACLLLAVVLGTYQTLRGRVDQATNTAETGLLLAHELLVNGALSGDRDLVMSLVAERPALWHDLVADLVSRRLFFSRRPLGLEVVRDSSYQPVGENDIRLSPELDAAEIIDRRPYVVAGRDMTETVELEHVFFYERRDDQWQLSPPADEGAFWGNWVTDQRANITLTYPGRDEEVAIKLSDYLDAFLPALCASEGMTCPVDFHLELKLERDPTSIRRLREGVFAIRASSAATGDRLVLPAPTLVGKPVDEAGYEALRRGYASWIGASIAAGYGHSEDGVAAVLAQFDLQPPLAPAGPLPRPAWTSLPAGSAPPGQDVLLLCNDGLLDRLLRFETGSGTWREEDTGDIWGQAGGLSSGRPTGPRSFLSRLPDYQGVIVQTYIGEGEQTILQTYLLRDGLAQLLVEEGQTHYYLPPRLQPSRQPPSDLLAFLVPGDDEGEGFSALLVNLDQCSSSPCQATPLPGMPIWSPAGQRTVLIVPQPDGSQKLFLGDENGDIAAEVGIGQSPVWLDEHRFVYIPGPQEDEQDQLLRRLGQEVLLVDVDEELLPGGEMLFDAEMVRAAIPAAMRPDNLGLWAIQRAEPGSSWWYVTARGDWEGKRADYVLVYDQAAGETRLVLPLEDYALVEPPMVNATGQQAVTIALTRDGSQVSIELMDADTGEIRRLAELVPQDWSADGDWLIQLDQGEMFLVSTASDVQWPIQHGLSGCYWAVWVEQEEK